MKKQSKGILGLILVFGIQILTGCSFNQQNLKGKKACISIAIAEPEKNGWQTRAAIPSLGENEEINFSVSAISGEKTVTTANPFERNKYLLEIDEGNWQLQVYGFKETVENPIFYGEKRISVQDNGFYEAEIPVYFIQQGSGNVCLEINVKETEISKLKIGGTNSSLDDEYYPDADGIIKIHKENVPANTYNSVLNFYSFINEENIQLLSLQEKINVRQNATTNTWIKSGNTPYFRTIDQKTEFILTADIISKIINTTFYICSQNSSRNLLPNPPHDENSGSWFAPFETIQAAINKIQGIAKNTENQTEYTIYIDGPVTNQNCILQETESTDLSITLKPYKDENGNCNASLSGVDSTDSNGASLLTITKGATITLSDLSLSGNIQILENGNLIFQGDTILQNGFIHLMEKAVLLVNQIDTESDEIAARIKCEKPETDLMVINGINHNPLSKGEIERFKLYNPGYFLAFDETNKTGIIDHSFVSIKLPERNNCTVSVQVASLNPENIIQSENQIEIYQNFTAEPKITAENTVFAVNVISNFSEDESHILLPLEKICLKFLIDSETVIFEDLDSEGKKNGTITIPEGFIFPGNYFLQVEYEFEGIIYDEKILVKLL